MVSPLLFKTTGLKQRRLRTLILDILKAWRKINDSNY